MQTTGIPALRANGSERKLHRAMNPLALLNAHAAEVRALGARRIGIFGSYARGEATATSDVDVYVEFEPDRRTCDNFFCLHELLAGLFDRPIDLVTDKALSETKARLIVPTVQYAE